MRPQGVCESPWPQAAEACDTQAFGDDAVLYTGRMHLPCAWQLWDCGWQEAS